jgi:hypothetical protein
MAEPQTNGNGNGCYLLIGVDKIPIARSLAEALQELMVMQKNRTGKITLNLKNGGVSAVELNTIFVE